MPTRPSRPSRRRFLTTSIVGAGAVVPAAIAAPSDAATPVETGTPVATAASDPRAPAPVGLRVNGRAQPLRVDVRESLLDTLRERLALTGTKKGCDHGQCGACTVLLNGKRVLSCLVFAVAADGKEVLTIEGLEREDGTLHPMQQAFIDHDALQCGYCTPGQILSAIACIQEGHASTDEDIREYMSGNLCRCAAYPGIVAAIRQAAGREPE